MCCFKVVDVIEKLRQMELVRIKQEHDDLTAALPGKTSFPKYTLNIMSDKKYSMAMTTFTKMLEIDVHRGICYLLRNEMQTKKKFSLYSILKHHLIIYKNHCHSLIKFHSK